MGLKVQGILTCFFLSGFILLFSIFSLYSSSVELTQVPQGMILVEGGTFQMGEGRVMSDEEPVHNVTVSAFYIGKFEVTQKEWNAIMLRNPSLYKGDNLPVETVNWYDVVEYCNKKSLKEGLKPCYIGEGNNITCDFRADGYRLPTEAEWEYACRGGAKSHNYRYSGSNDPVEVAWFEVNAEDKTHPVGQKKANELGIYDMSGNAWEWCWDWYDKNYYQTGPVENPAGPTAGDIRIYRGGGAGSNFTWVRCTGRYSYNPLFKHWFVGFRVVKNNIGNPPQDMVYVIGGAFKMGGNEGTLGERIVHPVTVSTFYIGKYEVTQEEWLAVMKYNPSLFKGSILPVHSVEWYDAVKYCNKRSLLESLNPCYSGEGKNIVCNFEANGYRLPTEAEWEYAGRGGRLSQNYTYCGGNNADEIAWYAGNTYGKPQAVGQKKPNELGIYDMSGNAAEWCWDYYDFTYYSNSPAVNPRGPLSGLYRLVRGGGFILPEDVLMCSARFILEPQQKFTTVGFRLVKGVKGAKGENL